MRHQIIEWRVGDGVDAEDLDVEIGLLALNFTEELFEAPKLGTTPPSMRFSKVIARNLEQVVSRRNNAGLARRVGVDVC